MSLILSLGALLPRLFGKTVSPGTSKIIGIITAGLLLVSLLGVAKCSYDASLIRQHEAKDRAEKAEKQLQADRKADQETAKQSRDLEETQNELEKAQRDAGRADPDGAAGKVGPVTGSYYETLRRKKEKPQ